MADYTKGIRIKTHQGKFGEFMSVGINIEEFKNNIVNERGYVNFKITKSRNGDWYAVNYENQNLENTSNAEKSPSEIDDLPF